MIDADLDHLAAVVAAGGVIGIPTDTVYGLACDPRDAAAVERIYAVKRRPEGLELSLLAADVDDLTPHAVLTPAAMALAGAFWPGGLSLVVPVAQPRGLVVPRHGDTVSVRVPDHDRLRQLLSRTGPLATTSANRHGQPACLSDDEARALLGAELDGLMRGRAPGGRASTIIDCSVVPPRVLRTGPIGPDRLRPFLGD